MQFPPTNKTMTNYRHAKHHKLDDKSMTNLESIDTLMDGLETLTLDPKRSQGALQILDHMRRDYTRLDLRSSDAVSRYVREYQSKYEGLIKA